MDDKIKAMDKALSVADKEPAMKEAGAAVKALRLKPLARHSRVAFLYDAIPDIFLDHACIAWIAFKPHPKYINARATGCCAAFLPRKGIYRRYA